MSFSFRSSWFSLALHDPAFRPRIIPGKSLAQNPERPPSERTRAKSRGLRRHQPPLEIGEGKAGETKRRD